MLKDTPQRLPQYRIQIHDVKRLAALVEAAIRVCYSSQRHAARESKLSQTFLHQVLAQKKRYVSFANFIQLFQLVPEEDHEALGRALRSPKTRLLLEQHDAWVRHVLIQASWGAGSRLVRTKSGFRKQPYIKDARGETLRDRERNLLWRYVCRQSPHLARQANALFKKAEDASYKRLALIRILDPLLNAEEAGFGQVSWRIVSKTHYSRLEHFVRYGLQRERLLIQHKPFAWRTPQITALSLAEFAVKYGKVATR